MVRGLVRCLDLYLLIHDCIIHKAPAYHINLEQKHLIYSLWQIHRFPEAPSTKSGKRLLHGIDHRWWTTQQCLACFVRRCQVLLE